MHCADLYVCISVVIRAIRRVDNQKKIKNDDKERENSNGRNNDKGWDPSYQ